MTRAEELANMLLDRMIVDWPERDKMKAVIVDHILFAQREERQRCAEVIKDAIRHNWRFAGHAKGLRDVLMEIEKLEDE